MVDDPPADPGPATPNSDIPDTGGFVTATYKEIAQHFHLSGPVAARVKAKRLGWAAIPPNHPADALHIKVPRSAWDTPDIARPRPKQERRPRDIHGNKALEAAVSALREQLDIERQRVAAKESQVLALTLKLAELTDRLVVLAEQRQRRKWISWISRRRSPR